MRYRFPAVALAFLFCSHLFADGYIKARGKPVGPGLFVDGKYIGPAGRFSVPEKYSLPAGEHEITLKDPRYEDYTTKVTITDHKTTKIHYKMKKVEPAKPPFGRFRLKGGEPESFLSVASGDTGAVYINDKFYGYVDELNDAGGGILLNPGTYKLHVSSPLFGEINQEIKIEANKVTTVALSQRRE
jgi:hypothetical protein